MSYSLKGSILSHFQKAVSVILGNAAGHASPVARLLRRAVSDLGRNVTTKLNAFEVARILEVLNAVDTLSWHLLNYDDSVPAHGLHFPTSVAMHTTLAELETGKAPKLYSESERVVLAAEIVADKLLKFVPDTSDSLSTKIVDRQALQQRRFSLAINHYVYSVMKDRFAILERNANFWRGASTIYGSAFHKVMQPLLKSAGSVSDILEVNLFMKDHLLSTVGGLELAMGLVRVPFAPTSGPLGVEAVSNGDLSWRTASWVGSPLPDMETGEKVRDVTSQDALLLILGGLRRLALHIAFVQAEIRKGANAYAKWMLGLGSVMDITALQPYYAFLRKDGVSQSDPLGLLNDDAVRSELEKDEFTKCVDTVAAIISQSHDKFELARFHDVLALDFATYHLLLGTSVAKKLFGVSGLQALASKHVLTARDVHTSAVAFVKGYNL